MLRATARWLVSFSPLYMPALSPSMETGTIVEWKKKEGELVKEGDVICSIQTDKAIVDFTNTFDAGYLAKILMPNGSAVAVAATIALLVEDAADVSKAGEYGATSSEAGNTSPETHASSNETASSSASAAPPSDVSFSPLYMPALSPSMETGTIVEWKKKEGELVKEGDVICSIQTDKAIVDFTNTFDAGYLAKILMPNGSAVAVAATIALLVEDAADVAKLANYNPVASTAVPVSPKPSTGTTTSTGAAESSSSSRFGASLKEVIEASGPSVMRIAASLNPDLMKDIRPSGKGGRFLKSDFINVPGFNYDDAVTVPVKSAEPKTSGSRSLAAVRDPNAALDPLSVVLSASPVKDFGVSDSKLLRVLGNMAVAAPKQKTLLARK